MSKLLGLIQAILPEIEPRQSRDQAYLEQSVDIYDLERRMLATSTSQKADPSLVAIHRTDVPSGSSASTAPRVPGSVRRFTSAALIQRLSPSLSAAAT